MRESGSHKTQSMVWLRGEGTSTEAFTNCRSGSRFLAAFKDSTMLYYDSSIAAFGE